ncbi:alpha/beta hydrolase fold family protein [Mycolicibacterium hassiacum DSM 44199]|uniref:Alpha/beta hydrolase fold family protein n=1 Tax=Mycolicibacterium hassiacum (strain DSM 44199 / CIP 105218 / JCM 12690 / 3849) TaxID=1122247 RepID=K5B8B7_MYCHD|nr:alpha/beta fold hydrolase [Mycolicibacterium hassiacum]EKF23418.1 alpha/beta hydrolase fold family protein [Mycolicibacterium hassiacum DSM 44199]MDA4087709.1 hypothetical protein [Mycolicibacterium hassiacum DSM 44199]VCT88385.1 Homoserine O-acetyltransferase [Mycolicibacterium hassiacum DSM 44199]
MDYSVFELGDVPLDSGETLVAAKLAYKTYGQLNGAADNVVVLPTFYTGTHRRNEGFFGPGRAIDPQRHFVVSVNMFGNGLSTSPSCATPAQRGRDFPRVSLIDNVRAQHRLLFEHIGVSRIALVAGWSMAGCQAYHWAAMYPDLVDAIVPVCASARTSVNNWVFLEGVKAALLVDPYFATGEGAPVAGLSAFGRVYAGWAYSPEFFRDGLYRRLSFNSAEELLADWERDHVENWDAHDLLAKLWAWQHADIATLHGGDLVAALRAISARAIVIGCPQDKYFSVEDNAFEAEHMPNGELRVYESPFGHCVASPGNDPEFARFFDAAVADVLG